MLDLFNKSYDKDKYHCVHFAIDAAKELYNKDYTDAFIGLTAPLDIASKKYADARSKGKRISEPSNGCIVLMKSITGDNHVGIYHDRKILHLTDLGVHFVSIHLLKFSYSRFKYYEQI